MGRNPKPTKALKLAGTFQESRHGKRKEPEHKVGLPGMPKALVGRAAEEWKWLGEILDADLIQAVDRALLASYCMAVQFLEASYTAIATEGITTDGAGGLTRRHPSFMTYKQAVEVISMVSGRFGFSPVDRTKVGSELGDSEDDLAKYLRDSASRRANNS